MNESPQNVQLGMCKKSKNACAVSCGAIILLTLLAIWFICWRFLPLYHATWNVDNFWFHSGQGCYVFIEPKLVIFLGDDEGADMFDNLGTQGSTGSNRLMSRYTHDHNFFGGSSSSSIRNNHEVIYLSKGKFNSKTVKFFNGKGVMVFTSRGTKLTLADGREYTLDGNTPLWLRCKPDGIFVELEELPEGFIEYFENNPRDAAAIRSYPEAFQKTQ